MHGTATGVGGKSRRIAERRKYFGEVNEFIKISNCLITHAAIDRLLFIIVQQHLIWMPNS
jgi:hypothetical protein